MLTITSPPLKEVRELAQRSMCKGGMLYTNDTGTPKKTSKYKESNIRYIILLCCSCMLTITSPPLKEVRELAQRSMCKGGDVTSKQKIFLLIIA